MFGQYDGLAIFDMGDSQLMATLSLMVGSSGVARQVETHELIEANDLVTIVGKAKSARATAHQGARLGNTARSQI
jgi:uncharacterized protein with GYD domain